MSFLCTVNQQITHDQPFVLPGLQNCAIHLFRDIFVHQVNIWFFYNLWKEYES